MKYIPLKTISLPRGSEYTASMYPCNGAYLVNNDRIICVIHPTTCYEIMNAAPFVEEMKGANEASTDARVSEEFVFRLIEKTVELVKMQPERKIRETDYTREPIYKEEAS